MINEIKSQLEKDMNEALDSLKRQFQRLRTGRASPSLLDGLKVDYYGALTPLSQMGQVSTPEAKLLQIQPFDRNMIEKIEKSILAANLGLTPSNDGNLIRIPIPNLTEDKRKVMVKDIKKFTEDAKIAVRNIRRDQNDKVKKLEKSKELSEDLSKKYQVEIQVVTDNFIKKVDELAVQKEKELMTI